MTELLENFFRWSESTAEKLISIKDAWLGIFAEKIIPLPATRKRFRQAFTKLLRPLSQPLSEKIDRWIEDDIFTVANLFSFSRALAGPLFIIFAVHDFGLIYYLALLIWAGFSDYFDGIIARKMNQQTEIGAAIDAGCDKIFAACAAISFWSQFWFWPLFFFLLLDGTLAILAIALHRAKTRGSYGGQAQVKANWLGKIKYNLQAFTLISLLAGQTTAANYILSLADIFAFGSILRHLKPKNNL